MGLCPFHGEKSPSFVVSPDKRIFHCFGCHESGDHITFVMKIDNLSFTEAIKAIAEKAGITVIEEEGKSTPEDHLRETLQSMIVLAKDLFQEHLPNSPALDYLKNRGISDESIKRFQLGYCHPDLDLADFFRKKGFEDALIAKTSLIFTSASGYTGSRFRGRLMFPILDYRGRTLGFGGRILENSTEQAKYINSEDSVLFNKRALLYGLDHAKKPLHQTPEIILMEGYMDVITAHQYGFKNSVGTMGTALTPYQGRLIQRFAKTVYLCMDSDNAGQTAIERAYEILKEQDCHLYAVPMPDKDPADLLHIQGTDAFQQCLTQAEPMLTFFLNRGANRISLDKIEEVSNLVTELIPLLKKEKDPIIQAHFLNKISQKLKIDEKILAAKLNNTNLHVITRPTFQNTSPVRGKYVKAEESLLYLMATNLDHRRSIVESVDSTLFLTVENAKLFEVIRGQSESGQSKIDQELIQTLEDAQQQQQLSQLLVEYHSKYGEKTGDWQDYSQTLRQLKIDDRIREIKERLKQSESTEVTELLQELDGLIKHSQGGRQNG